MGYSDHSVGGLEDPEELDGVQSGWVSLVADTDLGGFWV
jgi:hypothetical protein